MYFVKLSIELFVQKNNKKPGKIHPLNYSDTIQKECIHQKKAGTRPLPQGRELGVKLVYC
ncbi:mCG148394 [Mus musculus]|jgi:hypothetical protein|nr:mCG148394 [Mus musculus]